MSLKQMTEAFLIVASAALGTLLGYMGFGSGFGMLVFFSTIVGFFLMRRYSRNGMEGALFHIWYVNVFLFGILCGGFFSGISTLWR